jgi:uncharacterized YccA/Bax inhibitor family protein
VPLTPRVKAPEVFPTLPIETVREAIRAELEMVRGSAMSAAVQSAVQARTAVTTGVFHAVAALLAVRLLLLLAILGGFTLALIALANGGYQAMGVLVAYAVLIVLPLVWLERNPRVDKPNAS